MTSRKAGRAARGHTTQADVARAAGVSRGIVSHALNGSGRMSQETRRRVLSVAEELDYQPHGAASELAARRSRRLVVVLPYLDNPFFDVLVRHLRQQAAGAGYSLVVLVSDLEADLERATVEEARRMRPTGLILPGTRLEPEEITRLGQHMRVCLLDRSLPDAPVVTARMDEADAAERIVRHLHALGHRHLTFLAPASPLYEQLVTQRGQACVNAAQRHGMTAEEVTCEEGTLPALRALLERAASTGEPPDRTGPGTTRPGGQHTSTSPDDPGGPERPASASDLDRPSGPGGPVGSRPPAPVAVVAYNDLLAVNVIAAASRLGMRVGTDIALVSYDNTRLAARPEFALTSVDQDPEQLARAAVELLTSPDPSGTVPAASGPAPADPASGAPAAPGPTSTSSPARTVSPRLVVRSSTAGTAGSRKPCQ